MIIGIGGCSNSGKSALAHNLSQHYSPYSVKVLCQDDFVYRRDFLTTINEHVNWEIPSTIKLDDYIVAVKDADKQNDLVICEGLFAFWFEELNSLYNKHIHLEIDKETFFKRKKADFRWGNELEWYIEHIWQSYLRYGQLNIKANSLLLDAVNDINLPGVVDFIDYRKKI